MVSLTSINSGIAGLNAARVVVVVASLAEFCDNQSPADTETVERLKGLVFFLSCVCDRYVLGNHGHGKGREKKTSVKFRYFFY